MSYSYPIDPDWTTEETIIVVEFLALVEQAYQSSVSRKKLLDHYREFKTIIPSKSEEKTIGKDFEKVSGYSLYRTIQKARNNAQDKISMS